MRKTILIQARAQKNKTAGAFRRLSEFTNTVRFALTKKLREDKEGLQQNSGELKNKAGGQAF